MAKQSSKKKYAAIDIGSNAIRLVLAEKVSQNEFKVLKKYRAAIRLGGEVFEKGRISVKNLRRSARAFRKMKEIIVKNKISVLRTVGTSALREARNSAAFIELVRRKSGIRVEIIDGMEEARLIQLAIKKKIRIEKRNCLLIDVGGGSVELTMSEKGNPTASQSFPFGTVRTLDRLKKIGMREENLQAIVNEYAQDIRHFLATRRTVQFEFAIGTGGNLEAIGKLRESLLSKKGFQNLTIQELHEIVEILSRTPVSERIEKLKMKPDRADVILPAALVVLSVMSLAGIKKLVIPGVGLKEGVLWSMANYSIQTLE